MSEDAARSTQTRQRIGIRSTQEYKRSVGEELTQCDDSKIYDLSNKSRYKIQNQQITDMLLGNTSQYERHLFLSLVQIYSMIKSQLLSL
jgi:hypothetical protein